MRARETYLLWVGFVVLGSIFVFENLKINGEF